MEFVWLSPFLFSLILLSGFEMLPSHSFLFCRLLFFRAVTPGSHHSECPLRPRCCPGVSCSAPRRAGNYFPHGTFPLWSDSKPRNCPERNLAVLLWKKGYLQNKNTLGSTNKRAVVPKSVPGRAKCLFGGGEVQPFRC